MRFITDLSPETLKLLKRISKRSQSYRVRQRAHCLILSAKGYTTTQLMEIFSVDRDTIYRWFSSWEAKRLVGLYDQKGKGRKPTFTPEQKQQIQQWAKQFPKNLKKVGNLISESFGIEVSKQTIKRVLKQLDWSWRRIRRKVKGAPSEEEYQQKTQELDALKQQDRLGIIDLRYFDESGFCLIPYVPYAWQDKGASRIGVIHWGISAVSKHYLGQPRVSLGLVMAFRGF